MIRTFVRIDTCEFLILSKVENMCSLRKSCSSYMKHCVFYRQQRRRVKYEILVFLCNVSNAIRAVLR